MNQPIKPMHWRKAAAYNIERMASHGERRAAEMEESALTLRELGLDPLMVDATVVRQREMGALGQDAGVHRTTSPDPSALPAALDAISKAKAKPAP